MMLHLRCSIAIALPLVLLLSLASAFAPSIGQQHQQSLVRRHVASLERTEEEVVVTTSSSPVNVGESENARFDCDESVFYWRDIQFGSVENCVRLARESSSRMASKGLDAVDFTLRHGARTGYFMSNLAIGGLTNILESATSDKVTPFWDSSKPFVKSIMDPLNLVIILASAGLCYEQDYERIQRGLYRKPWDMYTSKKQNAPLDLLQTTTKMAREVTNIYSRFNRGTKEDRSVDFFGPDKTKSNIYPKYYQTAFHYQTDGWMSKGSADLYEASTETLFRGRQDAMQRTCLPDIVKHAKDEKAKDPTKKIKVLELACGTGRFMTFVRDNLPLDSEYTATDLSPFYLEKARENDQEWRRIRQDTEGMASNSIPPARIVQANAEDVPFEDGSFDVVVMLNLFHEVPKSARVNIASEAARLCKSGGLVVFSDSAAIGDYPGILDSFSDMNEPYYSDYIRDDVAGHFQRAGLSCGRKYMSSVTKTLTFTKPEAFQ